MIECLKSYPFQVPVDHCLAVHVYQTLGNVFELPGEDQWWVRAANDGKPTSSNRFASLWALINSLMFPFAIHSDAIANW